MTQTLRRFSRPLLIALSTVTAAHLASASTGFKIMTDEEITEHTAAMAQLEGEARNEYRDAQYQILRQRAAEQGYTMPEDPPWTNVAAATAEATATVASNGKTNAALTEAAERHAAMREKMRAHREALLQEENSPPPLEKEPGEVMASETSGSGEATPAPQPSTAEAGQTAPTPVPSPTPSAPEPTPAEPPAVEPDTTPPAVVAEAPAPTQAAQAITPDAPPAPAEPTEIVTKASPVEPAPATMAVGPGEPPARPAPPAAPEPPTAPAPAAATSGAAAMNAYRDEMRSRFETYMKERQAQMEELARQQREQRDAAMTNSRRVPPAQPAPAQRPMMPYYPYPNMPAYGPRYPSAYPGYQTPYWQQR